MPTVKKVIQGKVFRKELYPHFQELGGDPSSWATLLRTQPNQDQLSAMSDWNADDWKKYIATRWKEMQEASSLSGTPPSFGLDESLLAAIKELLPAQPWPSGIHRDIADKAPVFYTYPGVKVHLGAHQTWRLHGPG